MKLGAYLIAGLTAAALAPAIPASGAAQATTCFGVAATIVGTPGNDTIVGTPGDDVIFGRAGDDVITGGGGNDLICGAAGDDQLFGEAGDDELNGGPGSDLVSGQAGNDRLFGSNGADTMLGGSGRDFIAGGKGNDELRGGKAHDRLRGDDGIDSIDGGRWIDRCISAETVQRCERTDDGTRPVVVLSPGVAAQATVDSNAAGTTYLLKPGIYHDWQVQPQTGDWFIGQPGAVLDGQNSTQFAFFVTRYAQWDPEFSNPQAPKNVRVEHLEIKNYVPGDFWGAIDMKTHVWTSTQFGTPLDWLVHTVHSHHNDGNGIEVGSGSTLIDVRANDNQELGIGGSGVGVTIRGGELARNSLDPALDIHWHAGGLKLIRSQDVVIEDVHAHHNTGSGFWLDISIKNARVAGNNVHDNTASGIHYEISYDAVIENNRVVNNAWGDDRGWLWGGGILISTAQDVIVRNNYLEDNNGGVVVIDQGKRDPERLDVVPPAMRDSRIYASINVDVLNNTIVAKDGGGTTERVGAVHDNQPGLVDANGNLVDRDRVYASTVFEGNSYYNPTFWFYGNQNMSWQDWLNAGQDASGELLTQRP